VKITVTAIGLMIATEQLGRKWSLIIGGLGQAFAMFYIGINQAVNPVSAGEPLNGHSTFAIVCVYLFVVFYSFGWGPIPFVLSAECAVSPPYPSMLAHLPHANSMLRSPTKSDRS
jgi:MFS transporter, SP family, sugar:H+ symporter